MNKIKQQVQTFKESTGLQIQEIAEKVFPDKTPKRAREILSRWINGYDLNYVRMDDVKRMCEVFKCEPNDLI
jgi:hypothetical protein